MTKEFPANKNIPISDIGNRFEIRYFDTTDSKENIIGEITFIKDITPTNLKIPKEDIKPHDIKSKHKIYKSNLFFDISNMISERKLNFYPDFIKIDLFNKSEPISLNIS